MNGPLTKDDADGLVRDLILIAVRAGRSQSEIRETIDAEVANWSPEVRTPRPTIDRILAFYTRPKPPYVPDPPAPASEPPATTHPSTAKPRTPSAAERAELASEHLLAERLATSDLRLALRCIPAGPHAGWRLWDGDCWAACDDPIPRVFAAAVHREVGALLATGQLDQRAARALETYASMRGVLTLLRGYPDIQLDPDELDPPGQLATYGGLLDPATGRQWDNDPEHSRYVHRTAVSYDRAAEDELWAPVAAHVASLPGGAVVQRFLGASLLGIPPDRKALFLVGEGGSGKGTLLRSCHAALGRFAAVIPPEALTGGGRGAHGHELLSGLTRARLGYTSELEGDIDWPTFKALTGGDARASKRLHGRLVEFQPRVWLAIAANRAPRPPDTAARDRCIVVEWTRPPCADPGIVALLASPGPERNFYLRACLRWLVEGCMAYQRDGLGVPDFARPEMEPEGLAGWFDSRVEEGVIVPGSGVATFADLLADARQWAGQRGHEEPSETALGLFLGARLAARRRMVAGRRVMTYVARIDRL